MCVNNRYAKRGRPAGVSAPTGSDVGTRFPTACRDPEDRRDDAVLVGARQRGTAREAQTLFEHPFRHRAADPLGIPVQRLQVQRLPHGSRFHVHLLQRQADVLPADTQLPAVDANARQPVVGIHSVSHRHHLDSVHELERLLVARVDLLASGDSAVEPHQLTASEGGQEIAETVVVAQLRVLVVGRRFSGLAGQVARALDQLGRCRHEHSSAAGGDDLVSIEREGGTGSE